MRVSCPSQLRVPILLLTLLFAVQPQAIWAQSSAQIPSQTAMPISPAWNDAVGRLASRIGNAAGSQKTISLTAKNISSLTDADMAAISLALKAELARLGFSPDTDTAEVHVDVTLSQGQDGFVWVAEIRSGGTEQTAMVSAPIGGEKAADEVNGSVVLERRLVWQQAGKFLDFSVQLSPVGFASSAVILEPHRLIFYRSADSKDWQASNTIAISGTTRESRDVFGRIDEQSGNAYLGPAGFPFLANVRCTGGFENARQVQCSPWSLNALVEGVRPEVPGHEASERVFLGSRCGDKSIVLATGNGDWTQPDAIQGYLLAELTAVAVQSGSALNFEGPVVALQTAARQDEARAVVHNLKTGNYEGYVVTATCGH
jgi:hypothetical protein